MAARKKAAKKKPAGSASTAGIVRFKTGFPAGIRNAIRRRYGDNWHLSLQILDGDDGDGDDGDGDDGSADTRSTARAPSRPSRKTRTRTASSRGRRKPR
jgi:hypothetical protein